MAAFQQQFAVFFNEKMSNLSSMVKTFVEGQESMLESLDVMIDRHLQEQVQVLGKIMTKTDSMVNNQKTLVKELQQTFFKQMMSLFQEVNDKQSEKLSDDASKVTEMTSEARKQVESANSNLRSYCDSMRNCAFQFSESCEYTANDNVIQAQKSFKQAAEQIQETSKIYKSVEDGVVNASHKVDQLAMQWQNMLEESFTQHLDTLKGCSSQQQDSVKECDKQIQQHFADAQTALTAHGNSLEEFTKTQERLLSDQSEEVDTWSHDQHELVERVNTRVTQFLLQDLKQDQPTGATPQRRRFDYPTKLTRTEPHDILREKFQVSYVPPALSPEPQPIKSVSSEDSVPVFELSCTSTVSSDNGVYPLRNSEGDLPDDDSLEDGGNDDVTTSDEAVFAEPQAAVPRPKVLSAKKPVDKENVKIAVNKASSFSDLAGVGSKIPTVNKFKTPVDRIKRPLRSMNTQ